MTNAIEVALRRIAADLDSLSVGWALIGGFAVSARSEPRFTRDIDVCVLVAGDDGAERVVAALVAVGYRVHTLVEQDAVGRLATVRLSAPNGRTADVVIDLLFASSDASDLIALRPVLSTRDRVDAEEAVKLVVKRGYHRARDLAGLLSEYLSSG